MDNNGVDSSELYVAGQNVSFIRKTVIICMLSYSAFGILDFLIYPEYLKSFYFIRFGIVLPYLVVLYGLSYTNFFLKSREYLLVILYILAGSGIVVMIYIIGGNNYYTSGLFLVFGIGFYLIRLKVWNNLIAFFSIIIFFILAEFLGDRMTIQEILVNTFFYISYGIFSIFGSFFNTKYIKAQYKFENAAISKGARLEERINEQLKKINLQLKEINTVHEETIYSLAKLAEARDKLTADHLQRVGDLSFILASELPESLYTENKLNKEKMLKSIKLSSILHDVGKISIPDEILNKPGRLTKEEFNIMKTHTTIGAETLESIGRNSLENDFVGLGIEIAKYHHEKWDGSGYPTGKSENNIPLSARIVAIIDVFDALISKRPYKNKFSKEKSLSIIEEGLGNHFDPQIAEIFINIARKSNDENLFWK